MPRPGDYAEASAIRIFVTKCLGRVPGGGFINSTFFKRTYPALSSRNFSENPWRNSLDNVSDDTLDLAPEETSEPAPKHIPYHAVRHISEHIPESSQEHIPEPSQEHTRVSSHLSESLHALEPPHTPVSPPTPEFSLGPTPVYTPPPSSAEPLHSLDYKTYRSLPKPQFPIRMSDAAPQPFSLEDSQRWIRWDVCFLGLSPSRPEWRIAPEIQLIKLVLKPTLELLGMDGNTIEVAYLSQGGFNKVYTITTRNQANGCPQDYVFRIPLPVYPHYKIESEVATMEYVRHFTSIPVPKVYAYDSTSTNALGLEWMLMEKAIGDPLAARWLDMSNEAHISLAQQVATWQDELVNNMAYSIGGLYMRWTTSELEFFIGPSVHHVFWRERRFSYNANRGPFDTIRDFVDAALTIQYQETEDPAHQPPSWLEKVRDQDSKLHYAEIRRENPDITDEDAENYYMRVDRGIPSHDLDYARARINSLRESLPRICDPDEKEDFASFLNHGDLSARNILVDSQGRITTVLDWESIEFLPIAFFSVYPECLQSRDREDTGDLMWERYFGGSLDEWERFEEWVGEIIQTNLRPVYKDHLHKLDSTLTICEEEADFWVDLLEKTLDVIPYRYDTDRWIKQQWDYVEEKEELARNSEHDDPGELEDYDPVET